MEFPNFAETQQISRNACISALKSCPDYAHLLILGNFLNKRQEFGGIPQIWWNSWKFGEISGILRIFSFLQKNAIRAEMTKNTYKKHWDYNTFESRRKTGSVFVQNAEFPKICKIMEFHKILRILENLLFFAFWAEKGPETSDFVIFRPVLRFWARRSENPWGRPPSFSSRKRGRGVYHRLSPPPHLLLSHSPPLTPPPCSSYLFSATAKQSFLWHLNMMTNN